jgi:hypothetical protein
LKTVILLTDGVDTTSQRVNYADSLKTVEQNTTPVFPVYFDTLASLTKGSKNANVQSILNSILSGSVLGSTARGSRVGGGTTAEEYELGRFYLKDISRLSGGRSWQVKDINDLSANNIGNIGAEMRVQYQITFRPSDFVIGQRKQITVRVNRPNLFVQARGSMIISDRP